MLVHVLHKAFHVVKKCFGYWGGGCFCGGLLASLKVIASTKVFSLSLFFSANIEITRVRKSNESEIAVMKAALKKEQTKSASLEMSLQQKVCLNCDFQCSIKNALSIKRYISLNLLITLASFCWFSKLLTHWQPANQRANNQAAATSIDWHV